MGGVWTMSENIFEKRVCCRICGFPVEMARRMMVIGSDPYSLVKYLGNRCNGCGHQKDGTTISVVHERILQLLAEKGVMR